MTCAEVQDQIVDFLYGELDEASRRGFEAHVVGCESCRREVEGLGGTLGQVRGVLTASMEEPPASVRATAARLADTVAARAGRPLRTIGAPAIPETAGGIWRLLRQPWFFPAFAAASVLALFLVAREVIVDGPQALTPPAAEESAAAPAPAPTAPPPSPPVAVAAPAAPAPPEEPAGAAAEATPVAPPAAAPVVAVPQGALGGLADSVRPEETAGTRATVSDTRPARRLKREAPATSAPSKFPRPRAAAPAVANDDPRPQAASPDMEGAQLIERAEPPSEAVRARELARPATYAPLSNRPPASAGVAPRKAYTGPVSALAPEATPGLTSPHRAPADAQPTQQALVELGERLLGEGRGPEAVAVYRSLIARFPTHADVPTWKRKLDQAIALGPPARATPVRAVRSNETARTAETGEPAAPASAPATD